MWAAQRDACNKEVVTCSGHGSGLTLVFRREPHEPGQDRLTKERAEPGWLKLSFSRKIMLCTLNFGEVCQAYVGIHQIHYFLDLT